MRRSTRCRTPIRARSTSSPTRSPPARRGESFAALSAALYEWLAARARADATLAQRRTLASLWDRIRAATRETEALNLDRRLHVLAVFEDIASEARRL